MTGNDQPGPAVGRRRVAQRGRVQPSVCLSRRNVCSTSKRRRNDCRPRSTSAGAAPVRDHHSRTGWFTPPLGSFSTAGRITVPSRSGRSPSWSSQAARRVEVVVTACSSPQVEGSPKTNSPPCLGGRPPLAAAARSRDGTGERRKSSAVQESVQQGEGRVERCGEGEREVTRGTGLERRKSGVSGVKPDSRESAQQEEDQTRPKSMWERVTSHCCGCMGQVEQASECTSTEVRSTAHSMDRLDNSPRTPLISEKDRR